MDSASSANESEIVRRLQSLIDQASSSDGNSARAGDDFNRCVELVREIWPEISLANSSQAPSSTNDDNQPIQANQNPAISGRLDRFEVRSLLGHGGFGVVLLAYDKTLAREVALKIPRPDLFLVGHTRERFLREARAAAKLSHPGIVPVFDAGELGSMWYIAAGYVKGPSLAAWLRQQVSPVASGLAASIVASLADAIGHAHSRGILHRDLKPSNVMLEPLEPGESLEFPFVPKLTDFGLSKGIDASDEQTLSGALIGTPRYMSPEQASGSDREVGMPSDIYSLGVILYELLVGEPPFVGQNDSETLRKIHAHRLSSAPFRRRHVVRDLETICLKCLEREPLARYASARELGEDLRRFLRGIPVMARPIGAGERLVRWSRRNPVIASLSAAVLVTLLAGTAISTIFAFEARRHADDAMQSEKVALGRSVELDLQRTISEDARLAAAEGRQRAAAREDEARRLYLANMSLVEQAWNSENVDRVQQLLDTVVPKIGDEDYREFEYNIYRQRLSAGQVRTLIGHSDSIWRIDLSPDGTRLVSAAEDGTVRIWSLADGREIGKFRMDTPASDAKFSPDSNSIAASGMRTVQIWDAKSGELLHSLVGHEGKINRIAYSPDGRTIASTSIDRNIKFWDTETGECSAVFSHPKISKEGFGVCAFSPDGTVFTASDSNRNWGQVMFWNSTTLEPMPIMEGAGLIFSSDGLRYLTLKAATQLQLCEFPSHQLLDTVIHIQSGSVNGYWFSPDDRLLATSGKTVRIWDLASRQILRTPQLHSDVINVVRFAKDSRTAITASSDRTIKIWNVFADQEFQLIDGNQVPRLASALQAGADPSAERPLADCGVRAIEFSRNSEVFVIGTVGEGVPSKICIGFAKQPDKVVELSFTEGESAYLTGIAVSPDGTRLAASTATPSSNAQATRLPAPAFLWNLTNLTEPPIVISGHNGGISAVAISPDGTTIATAGLDHFVGLWDAATGHSKAKLATAGPVLDVKFSSDGKLLSAAGSNGRELSGEIYLWNAQNQQMLATMPDPTGIVNRIAFSPDDKELASASVNSLTSVGRTKATVRIWNLPSQVQRLEMHGHRDVVTGLNYAPSGRRLVAGSSDGTVRLWETYAGKEVTKFLETPTQITSMAFSPDGKLFVAGDAEGRAMAWTANPNRDYLTWLGHVRDRAAPSGVAKGP